MTVPAYHDARNDLDLVGPPLAVYLHLLHDVLDVHAFREVKQEALAARMKYSLRTIASAMELLVERGYITKGPVHPGETRKYQLVYSRLP